MSDIITIIKPSAAKAVSTEEREIIFRRLATESKLYDYHFKLFAQGEEQLVSKENRRKIPQIASLLARSICSHPLVIPIRKTEFPVLVSGPIQYLRVKQKDLKEMLNSEEEYPESDDEPEEINVGVDIEHIKHGGDATKIKRVNKLKDSPEIKEGPESIVDIANKAQQKTPDFGNIFSFPVQLKKPTNTYAYTSDLSQSDENTWMSFQVAEEQSFEMCGFLLIKPDVYPTVLGNAVNQVMSYATQIKLGLYNYKELGSSDYSESITVPTLLVLFSDEKMANDSMKNVYELLFQADDYYENEAQVNFISNMQQALSIRGKEKPIGYIQKNLAKVLEVPPKVAPQIMSGDKLDPRLANLLKRLKGLYEIPVYSYPQVLASLMDLGIFDLWEHVVINGFDAEFDSKMESLQQKHSQHKMHMNMLNERYDRYALNVHYVSIVQAKFGINRANELNLDKNVLNQLRPDERKTVERVYQKQKKDWELIQQNKCAHVPLLKKLRQAISQEQLHLFDEITPYLSKKHDEHNQILCQDCELPLLCPHVVDELTAIKKNTPMKDIRNILLKYVGDTIGESYYCKHCGEQILDSIQLEEVNEFMNELRGENYREENADLLYSRIWSEISYLVYNRLYFKGVYSVKSIIQHVVDSIYNDIYSIETKLNKAKTNTVESIEERSRLYAAIYGIAGLILIIKSNPEKIWFSTKRGQTKKGSKLEELFQQAMIIIIDSKTITLRKYNLSNDNLLGILKQAYILIAKRQAWDDKTPEKVSQTELFIDPVYKYFYLGVVIDHLSHGKQPPNIDDIDVLFNLNKKDLQKAVGLYNHAKIPKLDKLVSLADRYWKMAYLSYFKVDVPELPQVERQLMQSRRLAASPLFLKYPMSFHRGFSRVAVNLAQMYDQNGKLHKWNIYVYRDSKKSVELTKSEIEQIYQGKGKISIKEFHKCQLENYKCSTCHQLLNNIQGRNLEAILDAIDQVQNFYRYYEYRCPEKSNKDGIHTWSDESVDDSTTCSKCLVTRKQIFDKDNRYYSKYRQVYINRTEQEKVVSFQVSLSEKEPTSIAKWKFNTQVITQLAKISGRKYNVLANLGLTEKIEYDLIENGTENPSICFKPSAHRLNRINGYLIDFLRQYNMLRQRSVIKSVPFEVKELVKSHEYKTTDLPELLDDYMKHERFIRANIERGINYVIDALYSSIIKLIGATTQKEVLKKFAEYALNDILRKDKLYSKPKEVNLGLVADHGTDQDLAYESESEEDVSPDTVDRFSADGYDYEPGENEDHDYKAEY
jgi:acetolactate synthase regulatory subunit